MIERLFISQRFGSHVSQVILVPKMILSILIFWVAKFIKIEVRVAKITFLKIALNRLLTLPDYSIGLELLISSGIIDFENKNISVVTKH